MNPLLVDLLAKIEEGIPEHKALFLVVMSDRLRMTDTFQVLTHLKWALARHREAADSHSR